MNILVECSDPWSTFSEYTEETSVHRIGTTKKQRLGKFWRTEIVYCRPADTVNAVGNSWSVYGKYEKGTNAEPIELF